jgi:hypothetical protein
MASALFGKKWYETSIATQAEATEQLQPQELLQMKLSSRQRIFLIDADFQF